MRIKRTKVSTFEDVFLLDSDEYDAILERANRERQGQSPMTQIIGATFNLKGDEDHARENFHLDVIKRKQISR